MRRRINRIKNTPEFVGEEDNRIDHERRSRLTEEVSPNRDGPQHNDRRPINSREVEDPDRSLKKKVIEIYIQDAETKD